MEVQNLHLTAVSACRGFVDRCDVNKIEIWNLVLPISQLPKNLPLDPNVRNAALTAKPVKAMLETLRLEPDKFIYYNNGLMLIAKTIKARKSSGGEFEVQLEIETPNTDDEDDFLGHGIVNGGHTYSAIIHTLYGEHNSKESYPDASKAFVQVSVTVGIPEEDIPRISHARNLSQPVPLYALKNLDKIWQPIEKALPEDFCTNVVFKPNEAGNFNSDSKYNVTDLIKRLALLNNELFDFKKDKHPLKAYNSIGSLVEDWDEANYQNVLPLLKDILWLEEQIIKQHEKINNEGSAKVVITEVNGCNNKPMQLITGYETDNLTIADIYYMPILAAFRVFIKEGQWIEPINDLWDKWGNELVDLLWTTYRQEGRSNANTFARSRFTWSSLTSRVAMSYFSI